VGSEWTRGSSWFESAVRQDHGVGHEVDGLGATAHRRCGASGLVVESGARLVFSSRPGTEPGREENEGFDQGVNRRQVPPARFVAGETVAPMVVLSGAKPLERISVAWEPLQIGDSEPPGAFTKPTVLFAWA